VTFDRLAAAILPNALNNGDNNVVLVNAEIALVKSVAIAMP
jgi:hypothetical protein